MYIHHILNKEIKFSLIYSYQKYYPIALGWA